MCSLNAGFPLYRTPQLAKLKGWTLVTTPDAVFTKRRNSLTRMSAPPLARTSPQPLSPRTPTKSLSGKGEIHFLFHHSQVTRLPA